MKRLALAAAALSLLAASAAAAELPTYGVSPLLPPDHWAVRAATRLDGMGLVTGYLPATQAAPIYMVWAALEEGARRAESERPEMAALARGWRDRFLSEWSGVADRELLRLVGMQASAGWKGAWVTPPPAAPPPYPWAPAPPYAWSLTPPQTDSPFLEAAGVAALSDHLALGLAPAADTSSVTLAGELVAGIGPVSLSVGRAPNQSGFAAPGGGVVMGGNALTDSVSFQIYRPLDIFIGLVTLDLSLARMGSPHPGGTLLLDWSLRYQPVPRLTFALTSGVMATGDYWRAFTYSGNGDENNVISVSARWRLPTEQALPMTLYLDWGTDDNGGAWIQAPGIDAGILVPSLPFAPEVSVGLEWSFFGTLCASETGGTFCRSPGYPIDWYVTWFQPNSLVPRGVDWVLGNHPLGHRMGGSGRELLLYGSADLLDARLIVRGDLFLRDRFSANAYAPYGGTSGGFDLQASWRVGPAQLDVAASLETGAGWTAVGGGVRATVFH